MVTHVELQQRFAEKFIKSFQADKKIEGIVFLGSIARYKIKNTPPPVGSRVHEFNESRTQR